jgi:hypothetical protein
MRKHFNETKHFATLFISRACVDRNLVVRFGLERVVNTRLSFGNISDRKEVNGTNNVTRVRFPIEPLDFFLYFAKKVPKIRTK